MEICGRIEPQVKLLFPISFPLTVNISVDGVWITAEIPKKLEVDLIPGRTLRSHLQIQKKKSHLQNIFLSVSKIEYTKMIVVKLRGTNVVCSYCASRVSRDKLDLHVNMTEQVLVLGLKGRP